MKKIYTLSIIIVLLCLTAESFGQFRGFSRYERRKSQGKSVKFSHSFQTMALAFAPHKNTISLSFTEPDLYYNLPQQTKTYTHTQKWGWLITGGVSSYFNLIPLNENSAVSLVLGIEGAITSSLMESVEAPYITTDLLYSQFRIGIPVAIAFKHGGEVTYNKKDNFSFTLGAGLMPAMEPKILVGPASEYYFKMDGTANPFAFTEIGIFAFVQWKVKLAYYPKGFEGFSASSTDYQLTGLAERTVFTSSGTGPMFQLGIGLMPFSYGWDDGW